MTDKVGGIERGDFDALSFAMMAQPLHWRAKALALRRGADLLWVHVLRDSALVLEQVREVSAGIASIEEMKSNPPGLLDQYHMLAAFSLENLLKARIVALSETAVVDGRITTELTSHDLLLLARAAKIDLSEGEKQLCEILTDASVSSGRYPVPTRVGRVLASREVVFAPARRSFEELFERLNNLVGTQLLVARPTKPTPEQPAV